MTDYIEDPYIGTEYDNIFNEWYEVEGVRKIKELSRQLRTFFNYRVEVIRFRFRPSPYFTENDTNPKFFSRKQKIESLSYEFITLLKNIKKQGHSHKEGIQSLYDKFNKSQINKLLAITEKLSTLIHIFSEECMNNHPRFLKFIVILAQNICLVKKCLYTQFNKFYEELEINYHSLGGELERLLEEVPKVKIKKPLKQFEVRLTS